MNENISVTANLDIYLGDKDHILYFIDGPLEVDSGLGRF